MDKLGDPDGDKKRKTGGIIGSILLVKDVRGKRGNELVSMLHVVEIGDWIWFEFV